jgi:RIO kinase 1
MPRTNFEDYESDLEETGQVTYLRNLPRQKKYAKPRVPRNIYQKHELIADVHAQEDNNFDISYKAARHEAEWLGESLRLFYEQQWFSDVLRMVKGGKEASVYLCQAGEFTGLQLLAAKVYRPRRFRNLKNDGLYREGRENLDESGNPISNKGMQHAIRKRTEYGRELMHTSWLEHELVTLQVLHAAGADVPKPLASDSNAILMEYFGDEVMGAPTLNEVSLPRDEAEALFERTMRNVELMLENQRVHGDLSAYNILYWEGQITLIDFPQAVHPEQNRSAYRIFERDVVRVCEYFHQQGVQRAAEPVKIAADLWQRHQFRFVPPVDHHLLKTEDDAVDRDLWDSLKNA